MRSPTSWVRCATEYDITPYNPIAASTSASAANKPSNCKLKRGCQSVSVITLSMVTTSEAATLLSSDLTVSRTAAAKLDGETRVRTTTVIEVYCRAVPSKKSPLC